MYFKCLLYVFLGLMLCGVVVSLFVVVVSVYEVVK